jgi:hypothetical protein
MIDANKNISDQLKPQILLVLQNFYGNSKIRRKLKHSIYDTRIINRKNATYSRIVPYLENDFEIFFTECTPQIGLNHKEKFETDLSWLDSALKNREWHAVLVFGTQAEQACKDLEFQPTMILPHPVSFKWRKQLIIDTLENLKQNI